MDEQAWKIAHLNDAFREALGQGFNGHVIKTSGIGALPPEDQMQIFSLIKTFNAFDEDNDPYGEHDFGALDFKGERIFWKIDYYDPTMAWASEDPANPDQTVRVMTVMLAREY